LGNIKVDAINRVLVIKLRHIGDVLLAVPAISALKAAIPHAEITAVVPAGTEEMLTLNPDIKEVIPLKKRMGLGGNLRFIHGLRSKKFDLAVNMTEGDRGAILSYLSGARFRLGVDPQGKGFLGKRHLFTHLVKPEYDGRHRAVMDMDLLAPLGIKPTRPRLALYTSNEDDEHVARLLEGYGIHADGSYAVVHPTSRWLFKCWRDEAVAEVIDFLEDNSVRVVLTSGPDEKERARIRNILAMAKSSPVDLSGGLSLKRLASLLKNASIFFGVDTAPMHMAAAVGTPVVALFGPSDHRVWAPLGDKVRIIAKKDDFPCLPCNRDGCDGTKKSRCLEVITVDEAIESIKALLGPSGK
jgi:lipopolysaccharide heptosyltransferase III